MPNQDMHKDLALTLLTDAFASEAESEHPDTVWKELRSHGQELTQALTDLAEQYDVDLDKFLPVDLVKKIEAATNKHWEKGKPIKAGSPLTLQALYDDDPSAAHRLVLGALGHGVSPEDEPDIHDMFNEMDIDSDVGHFENDHDKSHGFDRRDKIQDAS